MKNLLLPSLFGLLLFSSCQNGNPEQTTNELLALNEEEREKPIPVDPSQTRFEIKVDHQWYLSESDSREVYFMARLSGGIDTVQRASPPLNISLVLDRSGSMESEQKLEKAKEAALLVLKNIDQDDNISIVTYESDVEVALPSGKMLNKTALEQVVKNIHSAGSTNLSGGILEGYQQVKTTQAEKAVNRILLLSDGIANQGVTDPRELQKIVSQKFDQEKIAISTFGVGSDFNEDLMTNLAEYGRGNYYFIDSPDDIPGIFQKELEGLLSVVAQNTRLQVNFPPQLELEQVYGYEAEVSEQSAQINFNDVFAGEEKVVLFKFRLKDGVNEELEISADLQYDDVLNNYERKEEKLSLRIKPTTDKVVYEESTDPDVLKNIVAFTAVYNFEKAAALIDEGKYDEARALINSNIDYMKNNGMVDARKDSALLKQLETNIRYSEDLEEVEEMEIHERSSMQKANKSSNYLYKKKK